MTLAPARGKPGLSSLCVFLWSLRECTRRFWLGFLSCMGMVLPMNIGQARHGDLEVNLRGGKRNVPEEFLNETNIRFVFD